MMTLTMPKSQQSLVGRPPMQPGEAKDITYPVKLSGNLLDKLKEWSEETGIPVTQLIRKSILDGLLHRQAPPKDKFLIDFTEKDLEGLSALARDVDGSRNVQDFASRSLLKFISAGPDVTRQILLSTPAHLGAMLSPQAEKPRPQNSIENTIESVIPSNTENLSSIPMLSAIDAEEKKLVEEMRNSQRNLRHTKEDTPAKRKAS